MLHDHGDVNVQMCCVICWRVVIKVWDMVRLSFYIPQVSSTLTPQFVLPTLKSCDCHVGLSRGLVFVGPWPKHRSWPGAPHQRAQEIQHVVSSEEVQEISVAS